MAKSTRDGQIYQGWSYLTMENSLKINPNDVNGASVSDSGVASGRYLSGQENTGRNPETDPELSGNQASSVAMAEPMTGIRTCSGNQATHVASPAKATGYENYRGVINQNTDLMIEQGNSLQTLFDSINITH